MKRSSSTLLRFAFCVLISQHLQAEEGVQVLCPSLFGRISAANVPAAERILWVLKSRGFKRFYDDPDIAPVSEKIARDTHVNVDEPVFIDLQVGQKGKTLSLVIVKIGPGKGKQAVRADTPNSWNPFDWIAWAIGELSPNAAYRSRKAFDTTFFQALTPMLIGIDKRLQQDPGIEWVLIEVPSVQNEHLERMLVQDFGFKVLRQRKTFVTETGVDVVGSHLRLEIFVPRRSQN